MKNNILSFILFFMSFSIFSQDVPFLKDLKFEKLEFSAPTVMEKALNEKLKIYSIQDNETPIQSVEIQFFVSELENFPKQSNELLKVLGNTWLFSKDLNKVDFLSQFEFYGANLSVHTNYNHIFINISYLQKFEKQILDLLSQFLKNPTFTDEGISKTKKRMIERIKRRNDQIFSTSSRKSKELIFKNTKKGKSLQSKKIEQIQKKEIVDYYQAILKKTRKNVFFVGNWQENLYEEFQNLLLFGNQDQLIKKSNITQKVLSKNLARNPFDTLIVDTKNSQTVLNMVGILPKRSHKDYYAVKVLNHILGGGSFTSYFGKKIRSDEGLAYVAYTNIHLQNNYGFFNGVVQTKSASTLRAYNLMKEILSEKTFRQISQEELDLAKDTLTNHFVFYFSSNFGFLNYYANLQEDNMPKDFLTTYRDKISEITLEDIRKVGKKYFTFSKMKTVITGDAKKVKVHFPKNTKIIKPEESIP